MRETRANLYDLFLRFCNALGKGAAIDSEDQRGTWNLNYTYGAGYVIHEVLDHGGVHEPFGSRRRTIGEMCDVLRFAIQATSYTSDEMTERKAIELAEKDFNDYVKPVLQTLRAPDALNHCIVDGSQYSPSHRRMEGASRVWDAFMDKQPGSGLVETWEAYEEHFDRLTDDWEGENGEYLKWEDGCLFLCSPGSMPRSTGVKPR